MAAPSHHEVDHVLLASHASTNPTLDSRSSHLRRRRRSPRSSAYLVNTELDKMDHDPIAIVERFKLSPTSARAKRRRRREAARTVEANLSVADMSSVDKRNETVEGETVTLEKENKDANVMDEVSPAECNWQRATTFNGACAMELEDECALGICDTNVQLYNSGTNTASIDYFALSSSEIQALTVDAIMVNAAADDNDALIVVDGSSLLSTRLMNCSFEGTESRQLSLMENGLISTGACTSCNYERTESGELLLMMENGLLSSQNTDVQAESVVSMEKGLMSPIGDTDVPALISSRHVNCSKSGGMLSMMESGFLSTDDDTDSAASYSSTSTLMTACLTDSGHVSPIKGVYSDNTTLLRSDLSAPFLPCDASSITLVDASCDPCFSTFESVTILENVAEQADTLNSSATTTSPESESTTAPKTPQQLQPYEFDPYAFIRTLPCIDDLPSRTRPFALPRKTRHSKKITLVLDLDETLVHCNTNVRPDRASSFITSSPPPAQGTANRRRTMRKEEGPLGMDLDDGLQFNVEVEGVTYHVNGKLRPHWKSFLRRVSEMFEVVVFTASQKVYADQLLNLLDPQHKWIKYRLYRESCILVNGNYLKDLTILGRDMTKVIIVDNSPQAFGYQVSNGIPITSFYDSQTDGELLSVLNFLEGIANVDDVRPHIDCAYGLKSLIWPDSVATAL